MSSFVGKLKKLLTYTTMLPLYWLSFVVPKDKNLWVFGAWFGERYADNSKYLFEYVNKYHPEIRAVWLTNSEDTLRLIENKGYEVYKTYSLKGIYYALRAKVGIVSTGLRDINIYATGNIKVVQLWHGIPLKKIMFDDKITFKKPSILERFLFFFFPFLKKDIYYTDAILIATSEEVKNKISSAFRVPEDRVKITGYPRNDSFFLPPDERISFVKKILDLKSKGKKIFIYMPTHRKEGKINLKEILLSEISYLNQELEKLNAILFVKLHYYHAREMENLINDYSNLILVKDELIEHDIYNILKLTDALITDYSSVFFDYLLLDRPIVFFPFDLEGYLLKDREFYYEYDVVTPGYKAMSWKEVIESLKKIINGKDSFKEERKRVSKIFHKYIDGNSSERVFKELIKELKITVE